MGCMVKPAGGETDEDSFKAQLSDWVVQLLWAERMLVALEKTAALAHGKTIRNDFAEAAFWAMHDGVVLEVCLTEEALRVYAPRNQARCKACRKKPKPEPPSPGPIGKLLKKNIKEIRRDSWKAMHEEEEPAERRFLQALSRKSVEEAFDRLFPGVAQRGDEYPQLHELEALSDRVRTIAKDVRDFRNKAVAHRKANAPTLLLKQLRETVDGLKQVLWDIYFIATGGDMSMELGGGANVNRFAAAFSNLLSDPAGGPL